MSFQLDLTLINAQQGGYKIRAWVCQGAAGCQIPVTAENTEEFPTVPASLSPLEEGSITPDAL